MLRARQPGDRFYPLGAPGKKKLHDFFIDEKVPRPERDQVLLCTAAEHIVWVVGHRIDERAKVTAQTRSVAYLRAEPA